MHRRRDGAELLMICNDTSMSEFLRALTSLVAHAVEVQLITPVQLTDAVISGWCALATPANIGTVVTTPSSTSTAAKSAVCGTRPPALPSSWK